MVPWTQKSHPPNGVSIGSVIFAQTHTDRHTDHGMCDICSNRPHLCTAHRQCDL